MQRRTFLATLGGLGAVAACARAGDTPATDSAATAATPDSAGATSAAATAAAVGPLGLQLYTVRDAMEKDMPGTLARVAQLGYKEVEFAGYYGRTPAQVRELLQQHGLTSPSVHTPIDQLRKSWAKTLDDSKAIGHEWVTIPWLADADRPKDADGWKRLAAELAKGAEQAQAAGLKFAYHNHDFEITPKAGDRMPLEILLQETDPARVDFEMDVYWVTKAGADPLDLFARFPGRWRMLHVKDAGPPPDRPMTPVGQGTIDWKRVFAAREQAGVRHLFVEHDSAADWGQGDAFKSVEASQKYLANLK
jgi:sugar phosphate isomerase/epimerase